MSDDGGKGVGAAAGAGGLGLLALLRVCSHEGHEVGIAARALQGAGEGAVVTRGVGRAAQAGEGVAARAGRGAVAAGEGVALRNVGKLANEGEHLGMHALDLLPHLLDLPIGLDEDDEPAPVTAPRPAHEPTGGVLLERALRNGTPLARHSLLASAWPAKAGERVEALPVSQSSLVLLHDLSRTLRKPSRFVSLAPTSGEDYARMFGAAPTAAETAAIEVEIKGAAALDPARETSTAGLWRTIAATSMGSALFIAGWSRGEGAAGPHLVLRDGTTVREGDVHAACFAAHVTCFVVRRTPARGDARGAFAGKDASLSMIEAAKARTASLDASARDVAAAMGEARAAAAPRAPAPSLTVLAAAGNTLYAVRSEVDEAR